MLVAAGAGVAVGANFAQEPQEGVPPMPKPGPEQEVLKQDVGKWSAAVKYWTAADQPPMEIKGIETNQMACSGLWMRTEFDSLDGSFSGRGLGGWDSSKKKYVSVWVDNGSTYLAVSIGTYDKAKKTLNFNGEQPDPATGKMSKVRSTMEYVDANTRRFTSWTTPSGLGEMKTLEIVYSRMP